MSSSPAAMLAQMARLQKQLAELTASQKEAEEAVAQRSRDVKSAEEAVMSAEAEKTRLGEAVERAAVGVQSQSASGSTFAEAAAADDDDNGDDIEEEAAHRKLVAHFRKMKAMEDYMADARRQQQQQQQQQQHQAVDGGVLWQENPERAELAAVKWIGNPGLHDTTAAAVADHILVQPLSAATASVPPSVRGIVLVPAGGLAIGESQPDFSVRLEKKKRRVIVRVKLPAVASMVDVDLEIDGKSSEVKVMSTGVYFLHLRIVVAASDEEEGLRAINIDASVAGNVKARFSKEMRELKVVLGVGAGAAGEPLLRT